MPQRFVNVLGNAQDPDGVASVTYSLNGGPELPLSLGPNGNRLENWGDFNVEIAYAGLPPGLNDVTIRARDNQGNSSQKSVQVNYIDNIIPPTTYSIDWSAVTEVSDVAQIVDGKWSLENDGVRSIEPGYDRLVAIGDLSWDNYEATVEATLNAPIERLQAPIIGLAIRWTGHYDWDGQQPRLGWHPLGALMAYIWLHDFYWGLATWESDGVQSLGTGVTPAPQVGVTYILKMRAEPLPSGDIEYSFKMWPKGQAEPSVWGISYISDQSPVGGSLLVVAHYVDVTIGNVAIVPVGN